MSLDRRQVLAGAGAAAAASLLPATPLARVPRHRDVRKAVKIGMVQIEGTLQDKFALLADLGFDGVELDSHMDVTADEVRAAVDATGVPVHGVVNSKHWGLPVTSNDEATRAQGVAAMERALREAASYGADTVLFVPGVVNRGIPYHLAWERSQAAFRAFLPVAEEVGVKVAIENVWNEFLISPVEARQFVDETESELVGWYLDVGNLLRYGWPEHWVQALGDRVLKLDVKEFSQQKMRDEGLWKGFDVELMEGDCDWPKVMAALDELGWAGWATAEVGGGGRERLAFLADRMDAILAS